MVSLSAGIVSILNTAGYVSGFREGARLIVTTLFPIVYTTAATNEPMPMAGLIVRDKIVFGAHEIVVELTSATLVLVGAILPSRMFRIFCVQKPIQHSRLSCTSTQYVVRRVRQPP